MSLILNIETATRSCSVALADEGIPISVRESHTGNVHSALVLSYIDEILKRNNLMPEDIDAVAVSMGPGSYTGLRIGVSTAKGLCYATGRPLISVGTLHAMAKGLIDKHLDHNHGRFLMCPMIDAKRMEVYTALFDQNLQLVKEISALVIDDNSFKDILNTHLVVFFGDGTDKCSEILSASHNARVIHGFYPSAKDMAELSYTKFLNEKFEDIAYFEPYYLKDFIAGKPKVKGLF